MVFRPRALLRVAGVASDQKHVLFPPFPFGKDFLSDSHAGTRHLVSVLDLDNVIVGLATTVSTLGYGQ
jgi:hypothetical protein